MLNRILVKIKKWNWSLFFLMICVAEVGALRNKNIPNLGDAFLFGLIAGVISGLLMAIITKAE